MGMYNIGFIYLCIMCGVILIRSKRVGCPVCKGGGRLVNTHMACIEDCFLCDGTGVYHVWSGDEDLGDDLDFLKEDGYCA